MNVMQQNTAKDVALLSNGSYDTGKGQAFDDYLWDTNLFPATVKQLQFFKTPIGSAYGGVSGDTKTETETSMTDTGKLPAGQSFLINGITISLIQNPVFNPTSGYVSGISNAIINAFNFVIKHSVWELKFTNTEYSWRDTGAIFMPMVNDAVDSITPTLASSNAGQYNHYNWVKVATKVPVSEQVNFSVNVWFDAGITTVRTQLGNALAYLAQEKAEIRTQLKGLLVRKV
jgi:hypothetical protein